MNNPILVEVLRGEQVESRHRGAVAVVDADGGVALALGDVDRPTFPRSAVKVLQALPLLETGAADHFGLTVIAEDVGDKPAAFTRFVAIAPYSRVDGTEHEGWRTAFSFVTDHRPAALFHAIEPFAAHGVDLLQLVSRPIPQSPFTYRFDAVLAGHPSDPVTRLALSEVRGRTRVVRIFGSYPAGA